jgi:hypothetical protein
MARRLEMPPLEYDAPMIVVRESRFGDDLFGLQTNDQRVRFRHDLRPRPSVPLRTLVWFITDELPQQETFWATRLVMLLSTLLRIEEDAQRRRRGEQRDALVLSRRRAELSDDDGPDRDFDRDVPDDNLEQDDYNGEMDDALAEFHAGGEW